jgi:hypothetical protein
MVLGLRNHPLCHSPMGFVERVAKEVLSLQRIVVVICFCILFWANVNIEEIGEEEGEKVRHEEN